MHILIHNQKGGVGKTTTAANLGSALARRDQGPVVLVDLDPQMHLTAVLLQRQDGFAWDLADWLSGKDGSPLAVPGEPGLWIVPGSARALPEVPDPEERLASLGANVILDSPPSQNPLLFALMAVVDRILTPLEPDFLGLQGVNRLLQEMRARDLPLGDLRLVVTRYNDRLALHREVRGRLASRFGPALLPVAIRNSVKLSEAPGAGRTIFAHAPNSNGGADYRALASWIAPEFFRVVS